METIVRITRNIIIFIMSYISFFQFLFGFATLDELIKFNLISVVDKKYNSVILSGFLFVIWIGCSIFLYKKTTSKQEKTGEAFHDFQHNFRNVVYELKKENQKNKINHIDHDTYYTNIRSKAENICNEISMFFDNCFGKKFNICIKMIDVSSSRVTDSLEQVKIITLCRSGINRVERGQFDATEQIFVLENTDFTSILKKNGDEGSNNVFATNNLVLYCLLRKIMGKPYKTSSSDYLKKYHSTIVVPIRIDEKRLPADMSTSRVLNQYQVFGFLCIDYRYRISKRLMKNILEYQKAFGDLLYLFFGEVLYGDTIINKQKSSTNS